MTTKAERGKLLDHVNQSYVGDDDYLVSLVNVICAELDARDEWKECALRDYERMKMWLNARGVTEWADTVSEVLDVCEQQERRIAEENKIAAMLNSLPTGDREEACGQDYGTEV